MIPGDYPLELYRGDTGRWQFKLWQDEDQTIPASLTGVTVVASIRDKPDGATVVPLATSITAPNIIDMTLSAANAALLPKRGAWDLQLTYPDASVRTVLAGPVTTLYDVTKP